MQRRRLVAIAVLGSFVAGACGSSSSDSAPDSLAPEQQPADSVADATFDTIVDDSIAETIPAATAVADAPDSTVPDTTVPETTVPATTVPATTVAEAQVDEDASLAKLKVALDQASTASGYRISTSQGQVLQVPGLGVDQVIELDRTAPAIVAEVDADGETVSLVDVGALFGGGDLGFEVGLITWQDDGELIVDTSDYERLVEFDPTLETSPFRPGMFRVDLDTARSSGVDNIVELIVGSGVVDPASLAVALQAALGTAEVVDGEADTFDISTTYAEFLEATGQDLNTVARGIASGVAPSVGVDVDELSDLYVAAYREAPTRVRVTIDETGVDTIELEANVSQIWEMIPDLVAQTDPTVSEAQLDLLFDGGVLRVEQFIDFDLDDSIDVVLPEGDFEDRTEELVALFAGG